MGILIAFAVGILLWLCPAPHGLSIEAWHLFAIFFAAITGIITKALPMGAVALIALTSLTATGTLSFADAFSGFQNDIAWLILSAFFIARGLIITGLGERLSYVVLSRLGHSSLGLGYGLIATDLLLAPIIPSSTARSGGIVFPIVKSLTSLFPADSKMGSFLTLTAFQGSTVTSALFLTSMAGNPLIAEFAKDQGIVISWGSWIAASCLPGLCSLIMIPYIVHRSSPLLVRHTPHARALARARLAEIGPMKRNEWIMLAIFVLLIVLWVFGAAYGIKATTAALIGLAVLLLCRILDWKDVLSDQTAWDTFIWFGTFVTMAAFLHRFGFTHWLNEQIATQVHGFAWAPAFSILSLAYFYSHYFFVSQVAHIGAMYAPLLVVSVALGTPPLLAALILGFFSNLFGGLTHYGSGPAAVFFGSGQTTVSQWWKVGAIISVLNIAIWAIVGGLWWKFLGLY